MIRNLILAYVFLVAFSACRSRMENKPETETEKTERLQAFLQLSQDERLKPANAMASFETADSLGVALFASEPMVVNAMNFDIDAKGRKWVLESPDYAKVGDSIDRLLGRITILGE